MSSLIDEVKRLKELHEEVQKDIWSDGKQEIQKDALVNAAPALLDVLSLIQKGDAEKLDLLLYQFKTSADLSIDMKVGIDWIVDLMRRMLELCGKMEAEE